MHKLIHTRIDPVDIETVVSVIKFVCDELESQDLLVRYEVWSSDINLHFGVTQLVQSAICHHFWEVPATRNQYVRSEL